MQEDTGTPRRGRWFKGTEHSCVFDAQGQNKVWKLKFRSRNDFRFIVLGVLFSWTYGMWDMSHTSTQLAVGSRTNIYLWFEVEDGLVNHVSTDGVYMSPSKYIFHRFNSPSLLQDCTSHNLTTYPEMMYVFIFQTSGEQQDHDRLQASLLRAALSEEAVSPNSPALRSPALSLFNSFYLFLDIV